MKKITIIKLSSLGDIIHTLPAFNILRKNLPEAKINWVVEKTGKNILRFVDGIDEIYTINTRELRKRINIKENLSRIKKLKNIKSDVSLDFQGTLKSAIVTRITNSKIKAGFNKNNLKEKPAYFFYNKTASYFNEKNHITKKNINLLKTIGIKPQEPVYPDFLLENSVKTTTLEKIKSYDLDTSVILNVGGGWVTKRLETEKWIQLSNKIASDNYSPLILWGNNYEKKIAEKVVNNSKALLLPFFKIKELLFFLTKIKLLISGDTLPLHMADALKIPTISFFGPTPPDRNGPLNQESKIIYYPLECSGCFKRECKKIECIKKISVNDLYKAFKKFEIKKGLR